MCSRIALIILLAVVACVPFYRVRKIASGEVVMGIGITDEQPLEDDYMDESVRIDSIRERLSDGPILMKAIRDSETGEMVATDVINASKVVARFRNVPERAGYVSISFDISVPSSMSDSRWQLKICPDMYIQDDTLQLDPIFITGAAYRTAQLRGYERYQAFLESIVDDPSDLLYIGQLEIFLKRHFPQIYAMKNDTSFISEPLAENLFGVTQGQVLEHYQKHFKIYMNDRRRARVDKMYRKYVKDPIITDGVKLDTILVGDEGDFLYRYVHTFRSRPGLKKIAVVLHGSLYEKGEKLVDLPFSDELTFYISTLTSLADERPKYKTVVLERVVFDNTKALIDFSQGQSDVDTLLEDNASELRRIRSCIDDVVDRRELVLDSLVVVASCSPEGAYSLNRRLSRARSNSILSYLQKHVPKEWRDSLKVSEMPENWMQLEKLVVSDTVLTPMSRDRILSIIRSEDDPDVKENELAGLSDYKYLREFIYPKLRSVRFDFHLHRAGMIKDTVHTTELDTLYMSGLHALKNLDYVEAVRILKPYDDYNSALAFLSADYNHSALAVLERLDDTDPKICYLKAMVLSRLGQIEEAMKYFELALAYDPYLEHRANLDPEMHILVNNYEQN